MSTDPPPPASPPGAADPKPAPPTEPPEVMHKTRAVDFLGRSTPIVYQNDNGPCPLLAICERPLLSLPRTLSLDSARCVVVAWLRDFTWVLAARVLQVTCCC